MALPPYTGTFDTMSVIKAPDANTYKFTNKGQPTQPGKTLVVPHGEMGQPIIGTDETGARCQIVFQLNTNKTTTVTLTYL